jgi:hypothetical protein
MSNQQESTAPSNNIGPIKILLAGLKPVHYVIAAVIVVLVLVLGWILQDFLLQILKYLFEEHRAKSVGALVFLVMGIIGLVAGIVSAYLIRSHFTDLPATTSRIESRFNDWIKRADGVMGEAAMAAFKEMSLTFPWEYINFVETVDRDYEKANPGRHIERIRLYGTMVGFAFLLPEAIRNHACRAGMDFHELELVASDADIDVEHQSKHLVLYPLWLTASVVNELLFVCTNFRKNIQEGSLQFSIKIAYLPFDLLAAAIDLPKRIGILQALDHKGLLRVLKEGKLQVGFFYDDTDKRYEYERYKEAIANQLGAYKRRKKEVWKVSSIASNSPILTIENPHWVANNDGSSVKILLTATEYDETTPTNPVTLTGEDQIRAFLKRFKDVIQITESAGRDIANAGPIADDAKNVWTQRYSLHCPCVRAPSSPHKSTMPSAAIPTVGPASGETGA